MLSAFSEEAPGLDAPPAPDALAALVAADGGITPDLLERVVPGWDIEAGVAMARRFLLHGAR